MNTCCYSRSSIRKKFVKMLNAENSAEIGTENKTLADVRENFEISKVDPKYMICKICGSRLSKESKESTFQKHLETKKHLKELNSLDIERKEEEEFKDAEIVTEIKTLEKLEDERGPSFFVPLIPHTKSSNDGNETGRKDQKNQNINSEKYDKGSNVQDKKETCKFLKFGKSRHGLSGKEPGQGKVCSYKHHPVCRDHEKWGKCFENRCIKYHLKSCREFMKNQYCTYGDSCKFWHPTGLKDVRMGHERKEHISKEEIQTELKNSRIFYGKNHSYLRQQGNLMQNPFLDLNQGQNTQGPFLEWMKGHKERQKKISEIVRILEQNKQRVQ